MGVNWRFIEWVWEDTGKMERDYDLLCGYRWCGGRWADRGDDCQADIVDE